MYTDLLAIVIRILFGPVTKNLDRGKKWTGGPVFSMKKVDRLYQKLSGHISLYITEERYPPDCSQDKKRAIGEKAAMFNVRKGSSSFHPEEKEERGKT